MKIGIMLRHVDQHGGGVLVHTRNLIPELLDVGHDHEHEFVLFYRQGASGAFDVGDSDEEIELNASNKLTWDQVAVPWAARKNNVDVIFNPKYSVPLLASCPTIFVCHGMDWYVEPEWSRLRDRISHQVLVPLYVRKSESIICVSDTTRSELHNFLSAESEKTHTIYHGVEEKFYQGVPKQKVEAIQSKYDLPSRFFLYCGQIYPPKNFSGLLRAFANVRRQLDLHLVVAGTHTWLSESEISLIQELDIEDFVHRIGWVNRDDLRVLYRLAEALTLPSLYESFGLPILEAMASGCPVVTSDRYAMREVGGQAAVLVDPEDPDSIANGMRRVAEDETLRKQLVARGTERASQFSWRECAQETLEVIERAGARTAG